MTSITGPIPRDGAHSVSDAEERADAEERVRQLRTIYQGYGMQVNPHGNGNGEVRAIYKAVAWAVGGLLVTLIGVLFMMQMRSNERIAILEIKQTLIHTGCTRP